MKEETATTATKKHSILLLLLVAAFCLGAGILVGWGIFDEHNDDDDDDDDASDEIDSAFLDVPYEIELDPDDFVQEGVDHPYFPLIPGTTMIYEGKTEDGTERIVFHVTNETRLVLGISCIVVRDTVY